jgi:hypothetical protein
MDNILALFDQLKWIEEHINTFYGSKVFQPTLDRMMNTRGKVLNSILRVQVRTFNRD